MANQEAMYFTIAQIDNISESLQSKFDLSRLETFEYICAVAELGLKDEKEKNRINSEEKAAMEISADIIDKLLIGIQKTTDLDEKRATEIIHLMSEIALKHINKENKQ